MEGKGIAKDLEQRLGVLETITKKRVPILQDNKTYFGILRNYIEYIDGENSSLYAVETNHGFSIPTIRKVREDVSELATNLSRYARTHRKILEAKQIFRQYTEQYDVELLSEMYFDVALKELKLQEKAKHQYVDSLK